MYVVENKGNVTLRMGLVPAYLISYQEGDRIGDFDSDESRPFKKVNLAAFVGVNYQYNKKFISLTFASKLGILYITRENNKVTEYCFANKLTDRSIIYKSEVKLNIG